MVSKAFSFPHSNFIGFDHLWQEIEKLSVSGDNTFPKHNVVKYSDNEYSIQLALAGYSEKDIDVEVKEGILVVRGASRMILEKNTYIKVFRPRSSLEPLDCQNTLLSMELNSLMAYWSYT